jgi:hypothetical protein
MIAVQRPENLLRQASAAIVIQNPLILK